MKKIFLIAGILLTAATVTFAQNKSDAKEVKMDGIDTKKELRKERRAENLSKVSDLTRNHFAIDFPKAKNVRFERTNNFDEVSFLSGKKKLRAYYDNDEELVGTTQVKAFTDLPGKAQKKILKAYPAYTIVSIIKFDDDENNDTDMILYGTPFDDADNYFVELKKDDKAIVEKVDLAGDVSFFSNIK